MDKKFSFAERIREVLLCFGITQSELSAKTGISKSSISHYLKGDWEGKQDAVYRIATAFGISEAWLMGVDVPMVSTEKPKLQQLTPHEQEVIEAYRAKPEMQTAVDTLLGIEKKEVAATPSARTAGA